VFLIKPCLFESGALKNSKSECVADICYYLEPSCRQSVCRL